MGNHELTPKRRAFAENIARGMGPSDAYRSAGYSCKRMSAKSIANEANKLLNNPDVSPMVSKLKAEAAEAAKWSLDKAVERLRTVNDKAFDELDRHGFREKDPTPKAFFDSIDRLNRCTGVDRQLDGIRGDAPALSADFAMLIPPVFFGMHRDIAGHGHTDYYFPGGRGSGKSSFASLEVPKIMYDHNDVHALVTRKVGNTLRTSVYAQMLWALSALDVLGEWECTVSPMQMVRKATGQTIYFMGLDDEGKIKGIKVPFGYIGVWWGEEYDQYSGPAQVRSVEQSMTRSGDMFWRLFTWNPPRSKSNWANRQASEPGERAVTMRSTYLDVPREWLGAAFVSDAEDLKAINDLAYRHEYLAEEVGTDGDVFRNVVLREIPDGEISGFKAVFNGEDWGYAVDPWVFVRVAYDRRKSTVYVFGEMHGLRLSNEDTAARVMDFLRDADGSFSRSKSGNLVMADSAEPKSIASHRALGIDCRGAPKWPNSVAEGIKWLQTRAAIVIDPKRCPLAAQEFAAYEYEADKDGNTIENAYPDLDNHTIDAVRYALSGIIAKKKET